MIFYCSRLVVYLISILVILQEAHSGRDRYVLPRERFYHKMRWRKAINPWIVPIYAGPTGYYRPFDNVGLFIINIRYYMGSHRDQTYITTGAFISSTRIVTAFNPFKKFLLNQNVVSKTLVLSVHYFHHKERYGDSLVAPRAETIQCGREILPLPDDADVFYVDKEKTISPLHDIMVFRLQYPLAYMPWSFNNSFFDFDMYWLTYKSNRPCAVVAGPYDDEMRRDFPVFFIVGLGFINSTEIKFNNKMHFVELFINPVDFLDCNNWIPREWGYFICIRNFIGLEALPSGSLLLSELHLYGVGSFMLTRNREEILVFTDLRPYRSRIMRACTVFEFKPKLNPKIWW